ncbi:TRAP transporter substrate-binding protein [Aminobacter sp. J44]|uniref:TRAP transporter substrate-binding protein n=1 Tax=Aminobacter sp. J44 TaxID=935262 RepID=UPI00119B1041|nr:TRAP transporter substrate-binding protein [Aminobacter sp. J44]TWG55110.1 TRAP-type C4-dicarboxylate transport system substrate-binding protein [Aminobacter sp. J44]
MFPKMITAAMMAASLLAAPAALAKELKLADFQPPTHFALERVYKPMSDAISAATNGEVTIKAYMGGELGPGPAEQYNRAVDGVADIVFALPGYTASTFPMTLLSELPGVIDPINDIEKIIETQEMLDPEYRRVKLLALWNNQPGVLFTASKPIRKLEDLKGLKIRVPSRNAGLVLEAWGGSPVSMPATEIYNAMQTGVIDGAMIDMSALTAFRLAEVTKYVTVGMDTATSQFFLVMNRDSFNELTEDQQKAVLEAGKDAARNGHAAWVEVSDKAQEEFVGMEGKELISLSDEEVAKFNAASEPVIEKVIAEVEATGVPARAYVEALKND